MGNRLAPLMRLRVCGSPSLGLGSRWTWSFRLVCLLSSLRSVVKVTSRISKVWCRLVSLHYGLFVFCYGYHTSHPSNCFVVAGDRAGEKMYGS